jgi:hypothetical protein
MIPVCRATRAAQSWHLVMPGVALLFALSGCNGSSQEPSGLVRKITLPGNTEWLHTCGPYLASVLQGNVEVVMWDWEDLDKPPVKGQGQGGLAAAPLLPDSLLTTTSTPGDVSDPLLLVNMSAGTELRRWAVGPRWYTEMMGTSGNGRFVALLARGEGRPEVRMGLLEATSEEPRWTEELKQERGTLMASRVAPSEDGHYVGVVGIHDGAWIAVADARTGKVLWNKRQTESVKFYDLAFSPDSRTVYAGGTDGGVFAFDVDTGNVLSRLSMGKGKDAEYGYRITRLAASPDGSMVAAGTGSDGDVHLWDVSTGKRLAIVHTGGGSVDGLAFSPDSTRLAVTVVGGRTIQIWKCPGK